MRRFPASFLDSFLLAYNVSYFRVWNRTENLGNIH